MGSMKFNNFFTNEFLRTLQHIFLISTHLSSLIKIEKNASERNGEKLLFRLLSLKYFMKEKKI